MCGSNISIVSDWLLRLFSFLPRRATLVVGVVGIILFALMTGGGAATVRAVIMGFIAILGRYLHRPALALRSLGVAVVLMILWNPLIAVYDSGFILSVLATFGLITLGSAVEAKLSWIPKWKHLDIRGALATTIAVEIFILPALLYFSGVFSIFSLPVNALVLPIIPATMLLGFITGIAGLIHPALAYVPALLTDLLLRLILFISTSIASLPFAATTVRAFPAWVALLIYIPLTAFAEYVYRKNQILEGTTFSSVRKV